MGTIKTFEESLWSTLMNFKDSQNTCPSNFLPNRCKFEFYQQSSKVYKVGGKNCTCKFRFCNGST